MIQESSIRQYQQPSAAFAYRTAGGVSAGGLTRFVLISGTSSTDARLPLSIFLMWCLMGLVARAASSAIFA